MTQPKTTVVRSPKRDCWLWKVRWQIDRGTSLTAKGAAVTKKKAKERAADWIRIVGNGKVGG